MPQPGSTSEVDRLAALQNQLAAKRDQDLLGVAQAQSVPGLEAVTPVTPRRELRGHLAKTFSLAWFPDSRRIVSASQDGRILVWDAHTTLKLRAISMTTAWVMACGLDPSGRFAASGGLDNTCTIYPLTGGSRTPYRQLISHSGYISSCKFLNANQILTSSGDSLCILWDIERSHSLHVFAGHASDAICMDTNENGSVFVSGSCDSTLRVWDLRVKACQLLLLGHEGDVNTVQFMPSWTSVLSASDDKSVRIFDLRACQHIACYESDHAASIATRSRSGRVIYAAYAEGPCLALDALTGATLGQLDDAGGSATALVCSPDGTAIATANADTLLRIYA